MLTVANFAELYARTYIKCIDRAPRATPCEIELEILKSTNTSQHKTWGTQSLTGSCELQAATRYTIGSGNGSVGFVGLYPPRSTPTIFNETKPVFAVNK